MPIFFTVSCGMYCQRIWSGKYFVFKIKCTNVVTCIDQLHNALHPLLPTDKLPASLFFRTNNLLITWSRVLLEQVTGLQPVKEFAAFYGTIIFVTSFTSFRHMSPSWTTSIQSITTHIISWISFLILHSQICLGLPSVSFPLASPPKPYKPASSPPYSLHAPPISFFSISSPEHYLVRSAVHYAPRYVATTS